MTMFNTLEELVVAVRSEQCPPDILCDAVEEAGLLRDQQLDALADMIRLRRQTIQQAVTSTLKPGDRIELCGNLRPGYLLGARGVFQGWGVSKAWVTLDLQIGRFARKIRVPKQCLRKI